MEVATCLEIVLVCRPACLCCSGTRSFCPIHCPASILLSASWYLNGVNAAGSEPDPPEELATRGEDRAEPDWDARQAAARARYETTRSFLGPCVSDEVGDPNIVLPEPPPPFAERAVLAPFSDEASRAIADGGWLGVYIYAPNYHTLLGAVRIVPEASEQEVADLVLSLTHEQWDHWPRRIAPASCQPTLGSATLITYPAILDEYGLRAIIVDLTQLDGSRFAIAVRAGCHVTDLLQAADVELQPQEVQVLIAGDPDPWPSDASLPLSHGDVVFLVPPAKTVQHGRSFGEVLSSSSAWETATSISPPYSTNGFLIHSEGFYWFADRALYPEVSNDDIARQILGVDLPVSRIHIANSLRHYDLHGHECRGLMFVSEEDDVDVEGNATPGVLIRNVFFDLRPLGFGLQIVRTYREVWTRAQIFGLLQLQEPEGWDIHIDGGAADSLHVQVMRNSVITLYGMPTPPLRAGSVESESDHDEDVALDSADERQSPSPEPDARPPEVLERGRSRSPPPSSSHGGAFAFEDHLDALLLLHFSTIGVTIWCRVFARCVRYCNIAHFLLSVCLCQPCHKVAPARTPRDGLTGESCSAHADLAEVVLAPVRDFALPKPSGIEVMPTSSGDVLQGADATVTKQDALHPALALEANFLVLRPGYCHRHIVLREPLSTCSESIFCRLRLAMAANGEAAPLSGVPTNPQLGRRFASVVMVPTWVLSSLRRVIVLDFSQIGGPVYAPLIWEPVTFCDLTAAASAQGLADWAVFLDDIPHALDATFSRRVSNGTVFCFVCKGNSPDWGPVFEVALSKYQSWDCRPPESLLQPRRPSWLLLYMRGLSSALGILANLMCAYWILLVSIHTAGLFICLLVVGCRLIWPTPSSTTGVGFAVCLLPCPGRRILIQALVWEPLYFSMLGSSTVMLPFASSLRVGTALLSLLGLLTSECQMAVLLRFFATALHTPPFLSATGTRCNSDLCRCLILSGLLGFLAFRVSAPAEVRTRLTLQCTVMVRLTSPTISTYRSFSSLSVRVRCLMVRRRSWIDKTQKRMLIWRWHPPFIHAMFLVLTPDYAPDVVVVYLRAPCTVEDAFDEIEDVRDADRRRLFSWLTPAQPQPADEYAVVVGVPAWSDTVVAVLDLRQVNGTLFAACIQADVSREDLLIAAGLGAAYLADVFVGISQWALLPEQHAWLWTGTTVTIVPPECPTVVGDALEERLLSPDGWDATAPLPCIPGPAFCLLTDEGISRFPIDRTRAAQVRHDVASFLGYDVSRLTMRGAVPRPWICISEAQRLILSFDPAGVEDPASPHDEGGQAHHSDNDDVGESDGSDSQDSSSPRSRSPRQRPLRCVDQDASASEVDAVEARPLLWGPAHPFRPMSSFCSALGQPARLALVCAYFAVSESKLLLEPEPSPDGVDPIEGVRAFALQIGLPWRYVQLADLPAEDFLDLPLQPADSPSVVCVAILTPELCPEQIRLEISLPIDVQSLLYVLQGNRDAARSRHLPVLLPVVPQPAAHFALAVALPAWDPQALVVVLDLSRWDGRVFAVQAPSHATRANLLWLAGLSPLCNAEIYAGVDQYPLGAEAAASLFPGECVFFQTPGDPPSAYSLGELLLSDLTWVDDHALPSLFRGDCYCLVTPHGHYLHIPDARQPWEYRREIAARVGETESSIDMQPALPSVHDCMTEGYVCNTVIAVTLRRTSIFGGTQKVAFLDCRFLLQAWGLLADDRGRLPHASMVTSYPME